MLHGHERAVILAEIHVCIDNALISQALGKALGEALGYLPQRGVQDRGIFPLDQAHRADLAGDGNMDVLAHDLPAELGRLYLMVIADGGEHAGNGNGLHALCLHFFKERLGGSGIQRSQLLAVIFKAATDDGAAHGHLLNILRPVHHGTDAGGGRRADAQDADGGQILALHNGVGALGRTQHCLMDLRGIHTGDLQHRAHSAQNTVVNIRRGGILDVRHHRAVLVHQDGIRIGAAHINSEFIHDQLPPLQRSSRGM